MRNPNERIQSRSCFDPVKTAAYISGQAAGQEKEAFEDHISRCDDCLEDFIFISRMLKETPDRNPGPVSSAEAARVLKELGIHQPHPNGKPQFEKIADFFKRGLQYLADTFTPMQPALQRSSKAHSPCKNTDTNLILRKNFNDLDVIVHSENKADGVFNLIVTAPDGYEKLVSVTLENTDIDDDDYRSFMKDSELFESKPSANYKLYLKRKNQTEEMIYFSVDQSGIHEQ